jgi:hypothetical protein
MLLTPCADEAAKRDPQARGRIAAL